MEFVLLLLGIVAVIALIYLAFFLIKKLIKYRLSGAIGSTIFNLIALLGAIAFNVEEEYSAFGAIAVALFNALSFTVVRGHRICLDMDTDWVSLSEIFKIIGVMLKASAIIGAVYVIIGCNARLLWILYVGTAVIFGLICEQVYIDYFKNRD